MKKRYYLKDGRVVSIAQLSKREQQELRKKNINSLQEQIFYERVFKDTVSFYDRNYHV